MCCVVSRVLRGFFQLSDLPACSLGYGKRASAAVVGSEEVRKVAPAWSLPLRKKNSLIELSAPGALAGSPTYSPNAPRRYRAEATAPLAGLHRTRRLRGTHAMNAPISSTGVRCAMRDMRAIQFERLSGKFANSADFSGIACKFAYNFGREGKLITCTQTAIS